MTDYSRISSKIGHRHWIDSVTHDDGQFAADGGGKSTASFSSPGKGKSTLMCYVAQSCRFLHGSKGDFVNDFSRHEDVSSYKVFLETVIWRVRDFDAFSNIIAANWADSMRGHEWSEAIKDLHLFVHKDDSLLFYSLNHKKKPVPVRNLPLIERYEDSDDLMRKIHWGAINAVVEPQTYHLSRTLIQKLREKKMGISEAAERKDAEEANTRSNKKNPPAHRPRKNAALTGYEKREISPAYFWFDMIHTAMESNHLRHITFCIDEWDDIAEARSEGDVWKLIDVLAQDWKTLRKANISTHLSTHQTDYVDWRILKRIDYFIWMRGAVIHPSYSMINRQSIVSDLPMGMFIIESRMIDFGRENFGKIPYSQPAVRIDGLKGQRLALTPGEMKVIGTEMIEA